MSNEKGVPVMTNEFYNEYIREIVLPKEQWKAIILKLKGSHVQYFKNIAKTIDDQVKAQGGY